MFSSKDDYGNSEVSELIETDQCGTLIARLWEEGLMPEILDVTADDYPLEDDEYDSITQRQFLAVLYHYTKLAVTDTKAANYIRRVITNEEWNGYGGDCLYIGNPKASHKPPNSAK